jgi:hypothetical protein
MAGRTVTMDADVRKQFEPQCPQCGWWRGQHRPAMVYMQGCPQWTPPIAEEPTASEPVQVVERHSLVGDAAGSQA